MYERPTLFEIGDAMTEIQGLASIGDDLDGHFISGVFEFGADSADISD
ncbi:MAG TPA: hypothetical protein VGL53_12700 [Bryobacteraceae bacterium]|jgi:hypothetical protein